jgi:hypothetical protein
MKFVNSYYAITLNPSFIYKLIKQNGVCDVCFGENMDKGQSIIETLTANDFWKKRTSVDYVEINNNTFFRI